MQSAIAAPVVEVSGAKHRSSSWISLFLTKPSWEHVDTKSFIFSTIFQFYFEFAWQASWLSCFAYMPADYEALRGAFLIDSSVASSAAASKRSLNAFSKNFVVVSSPSVRKRPQSSRAHVEADPDDLDNFLITCLSRTLFWSILFFAFRKDITHVHVSFIFFSNSETCIELPCAKLGVLTCLMRILIFFRLFPNFLR